MNYIINISLYSKKESAYEPGTLRSISSHRSRKKQHIIKDCPEITRYIHKFIVSKPCETLVEEIEKITAKKTILGILTRGSLAQYLYSCGLEIPIFQLEYDLTNILDLLAACGNEVISELAWWKSAIIPAVKRLTQN